MNSLQTNNFFLLRISKIDKWDQEQPLKSFHQVSKIENKGQQEIFDNSWLLEQRLSSFINFPSIKQEFRSIIKAEGPSLVHLIRLLTFFPRGLGQDLLEHRGFAEKNLDIWNNMGFICLRKNSIHVNKESATTTTPVFLPNFSCSFFINDIDPLIIPVRRLAIPIALILHKLEQDAISKIFENLLRFLNHQEGEKIKKKEKDFFELIRLLHRCFCSANLIGKKISFGLALEEFYKYLEEAENIDLIIQKISLNDCLSFFADSWDTEKNSLFHFFHPGNDSLSKKTKQGKKIFSCYPIEIPIKILSFSLKRIIGNKFLSSNTSFFETEGNDCAVKRQNIFKQIIQQLALIQIFTPPALEQYPKLNYIPVEGKWEMESFYFPWIFSFFQSLNSVEKSSSVWKLTKNSLSINQYSDYYVNTQLFRYLMWHPGLPFLKSMHNAENRVEEQIKIFFLITFDLFRENWLEIPRPQRVKQSKNKKNKENQNWDLLNQIWVKGFADFQELENLVCLFLDFLYSFGWLLRIDVNDQKKYYIPKEFPCWNPTGDFPQSLNEPGKKVIKTISFVSDFDFKYEGDLLEDYLFISQWSEIIKFGNFMLFRISRESIETYISKGNQISKIEIFLEKRISGDWGAGFQIIREIIQKKSFQAIFYPDNGVLLLKPVPECLDIISDPGLRAFIFKSFIDQNDNHILLIFNEQKTLVKEFFKEKNIPLSIIDKKEDNNLSLAADKKGRPLFFDFFVQRLLNFFQRAGMGKFFSEDDLQETKLGGEELTRSRTREFILKAIKKEWKLKIQYFAKSGDYKGLFRIVKPIRIEKNYLHGYCYLRNDNRMFLLNRIGSISTIKK